MESIASDLEFAGEIGLKGHEVALSWLDGVSNINTLLEDVMTERVIELATNHKPKKDMVLFCQHSSAGDVLMTTRCFDGIKNRYGLPLAYMTSPQYMDIIEGNPHIAEVLPWDPEVASEFKHVLNPHNDIILPGHWGRNCNSILSDFYWKILRVEPNDFFIQKKEPEPYFTGENGACHFVTPLINGLIEKGYPICVLHTSGGDKAFRAYQYMSDVAKWLGNGPNFFTVQLGGKDDPDAGAELDLRGRLSFRESAWVMDKAVLAVTIDSFISHLAGALGVSQVCLFGSGNAVVTRPNQTKGMLICLSPDYVTDCKGLGPCSGSVKDCPVPCTGRHSPMDIIEAISEIKLAGMVKRNVEHETSVCIFKYAE
jgi:ADP-heptose:LPS heptosyltransferase